MYKRIPEISISSLSYLFDLLTESPSEAVVEHFHPTYTPNDLLSPENGLTILTSAIIESSLEVIRFLAKLGYDLDYAPPETSNTPLRIAIQEATDEDIQRSVEIVSILLDCGANPNTLCQFTGDNLFHELARTDLNQNSRLKMARLIRDSKSLESQKQNNSGIHASEIFRQQEHLRLANLVLNTERLDSSSYTNRTPKHSQLSL